MKQITISGSYADAHSAITKLMRDGWHIRRFDDVKNGGVAVELYLDDPKRIEHTDMPEVREQTA